MGRNESSVELLVKVWEGIREFLEVPNESTGSFFRHMRVPNCRSLTAFTTYLPLHFPSLSIDMSLSLHLAISSKHLLSYVLPSVPQTGARILVQPFEHESEPAPIEIQRLLHQRAYYLVSSRQNLM